MDLEKTCKIKTQITEETGCQTIVTNDSEPSMMMDFSILKLNKGTKYNNNDPKERLFLLLNGEAVLRVGDKEFTVKRGNIFDDGPWSLHLPENIEVEIEGCAQGTEFAVHSTENEKKFDVKLYGPEDCRIEIRGEGQMNEAGTRMVRTILDHDNAPYANLMLGEDVHYPGKWAGFPSHSHKQPEIYFYRFMPEQGFGLLKLGDQGVCLEQNDTVLILPELVHPQVAAPGYAMYFLWVIRHLEGNPYIRPTFEEKHLWVEDPKAVIWPERK